MINQIDDEIWEIEDFLSEEENFKIINFISNIDDSLWEEQQEKKYFFIQSEHYFYFLHTNIKNRIKKIFPTTYSIQNFFGIYRYDKNNKHTVHVDNETEPEIKYGMVIYLNDDFDGGEVFYSDLNILYKPKKRSLLIHKADIRHEVFPVTEKSRYCLTTFARDYQDSGLTLKINEMI